MKINGRPRKIESREQLISIINEYFENTEQNKYTITGLCLHVGLNKDTFYEYGKRDDFKDIIDEARLVVENSYELDLREKGGTANIFALKNFGWKDKSEVDNTLNIKSAFVEFSDGTSEGYDTDEVQTSAN